MVVIVVDFVGVVVGPWVVTVFDPPWNVVENVWRDVEAIQDTKPAVESDQRELIRQAHGEGHVVSQR